MSKIFSVEIPADLETPVSAYLKLKRLGACFLLESAENNERLGRHSFIGLNPVLTVRLDDKPDCLARLRSVVKPQPKNIHALLGGLVGYISYEVANSFEGLKPLIHNYTGLPDVYMIRPETLIDFDHYQRKIRVSSISAGRLAEINYALRAALPAGNNKKNKLSVKPVVNVSAAKYRQMVQQAKEYIKAGDIFQVVLAHALSGATSAQPFNVYRAMRILNPSPYMFFFEADDFCLAGSSPEMLVKLEDGDVTLCPIAGTRPRGKSEADDAKLEEGLLASPKENAEHSMLVDLGRNDLGRVCKFGSIVVQEHKKIERYSHVMHLVSTLSGRLKQDRNMFDLFKAAFPAGTVTGAPKIRAMEIIRELEGVRRGPYAGAMGYFGSNGNMDMCLTIRTIIFKGNQYFIQAGAGIVYDSDPAQEYQETLNKMAALKSAIAMAEKGF
ncbi:MAG: anthranilate synthase component I family protein [Planctomycetes bacterium]|nr:anthranilate synthase component I family protein [Planctomycetota bacterium]